MLASVSPATRNRVIANPQSVFHHGQPRLRKCHSFAILTGDDSGKSRYNGFQFSHDSSESDRAAEAFRPWCITPLFGHLTATRPNLELSPVRTWNVIHHARKNVITPVGVYLSLGSPMQSIYLPLILLFTPALILIVIDIGIRRRAERRQRAWQCVRCGTPLAGKQTAMFKVTGSEFGYYGNACIKCVNRSNRIWLVTSIALAICFIATFAILWLN